LEGGLIVFGLLLLVVLFGVKQLFAFDIFKNLKQKLKGLWVLGPKTPKPLNEH